MQLRQLALQNFRNIAFAELEFPGRCSAFVGANAQGKTNLLEAIGFLTALRSFRQADHKLLLAHGQPEAALRFVLEHEQHGATTVVIRLRADRKEVVVDETPLTRMADFLGRFPTVLFSSQDNQLIRGSPAGRRRWLDLVLAAMDPAYFLALQRYHRALEERNALLKDRGDPAQLAAFEAPLAEAAATVIHARTAGAAVLAAHVEAAYAQLAPDAEKAALVYEPDVAEIDAAGFAALLAGQRERDQQFRSTGRGPHRDDFDLTLDGRSSRDVGSEGQQRSLVLALRLAQLAYFHARSGVLPLILADDVLGELDPARRRRFWAALPANAQVFATGTTSPEVPHDDGWQLWNVAQGKFVPAAAAQPEANA